jgi:hypothetical protein
VIAAGVIALALGLMLVAWAVISIRRALAMSGPIAKSRWTFSSGFATPKGALVVRAVGSTITGAVMLLLVVTLLVR